MLQAMKLPHWIQAILTFLFVLFQHVRVNGQDITIQFTVPAAVASAVVTFIAVLGMFSDGIPTARRAMLAKAAAMAGPVAMFILCLGVLVSTAGCLSSAPNGPVTPQNQAQVASCTNSSTVHNVAAVTGIALGAVGTGLGAVAAADTDPNVRMGLAIGGASSAALAGGSAAIAAFAAQNFANSHCTDVVGPLPMKKDATAWPAGWPEPHVVTIQRDVDSARSVVRAVGYVQPDGTTVEMLPSAGADQ